MDEAQWDTLHRDFLASLKGKELYVLDAFAGADAQYRLPIRVITEYAWHNLFCRNLFIVDPSGASSHTPQFTVIDSPSFKADPARHGTRSEVDDRRQLREEAGPHRQHQLRRRDEEVDLQRLELHLAAPGRAVDALLGQRRRRRRRRAVLRAVGHGQDDAVERSPPRADWRRRARLERSRRVQLRRRLLREDHQAVGRGRAADLRDDAPLRDRARERGGRSRNAGPRPRRRPLHGEHPRGVPHRLHRQRGARPGSAAIPRTS